MTVNRITGMVSGFDTDTLVKDLMKAESIKSDNLKRKITANTWEQEAYRAAIEKIRGFQSSNFDVLKPETNLRSLSMFSNFTSSVTSGGASSSAVSVQGSAAMTNYSHTIQSITTLASKDKYVGSKVSLSQIKSGDITFPFDDPDKGQTMKFSMSIDGTTKTVTIANADGIGNVADLAQSLNTAIKTAFGNADDLVSVSGNAVIFAKPAGTIKILNSSGYEKSLAFLGIATGTASNDYQNKSVETLLGLSDADLSNMKINGVSLATAGVTKSMTLVDMMKKISDNSSMAVNLSYNSTDDKLTLTADEEGTINKITLDDGGLNLFSGKLEIGNGTYSAATNAVLSLDGISIEKSSNNFTVDGLTYTLNQTTVAAVSINMTKNTDAIVAKIKGFVESYNTLVSDLNSKLIEEQDSDYQPLTEAEKEAMSEEEITEWEKKAKSGILKNNTSISNMLVQMRKAIYESVTDAGITAAEIGITTTTNYKDKGKLALDESKLKTALENNYDKVVKLFTTESDKAYGTAADISERYSENGIANRLNDILNDNVRTIRNSDGKKGTLIEKAGIVGDPSVATNEISKRLLEYNTKLIDMLETLADKEENYYNVFSRMESALSQMNSQSAWISQQLGA